MAEQFLITASLSIPASSNKIADDLKKISAELSKQNIPSFTAGLNIDATRTKMQGQLDSAIKGLRFDATGIPDSSGQVAKKVLDAEKLQAQGRKYFDKSKRIIDEVKNYYLKQGALKVDISNIENSKGNIRSFTALVEQSTGVIKKFNYETARVSTGEGAKPRSRFVQTNTVSAVDKNAGANLKSTINLLNQVERQIANVNSKTLNVKNPLQIGTTQFDTYKKAYDEIIAKVNNLKNANKSMTSAQKAELQTLTNSFKNLAREQQASATGATKLDASSVTASVEKSTASLQTLEQKWKQQGILVGDFKAKVEALKTQLSTVGDAKGLSNFSTKLSVLNSEAQRLKIANVNTANFEQANSQLAVLSNRLSTAQSKFQAFQGSMKTGAVSQFRGEIASVNSQFEKAKTAMANGNVAGAKKYFQEATSAATKFRTEMVSAGNVGISMFDRLIKNVRQFSSYLLSATTVMLPLKLIRGVIDNVKELDKALVNIQMATGGTYEETAKLVQSYSELGQKLGATTKEVAESADSWLNKIGRLYRNI